MDLEAMREAIDRDDAAAVRACVAEGVGPLKSMHRIGCGAPLVIALLSKKAEAALELIEAAGADELLAQCSDGSARGSGCAIHPVNVAAAVLVDARPLAAMLAKEPRLATGLVERFESPLHAACGRRGALDCARLLLAAGADLEALDGNGRSPMGRALTVDGWEAAVMLVEAGACAPKIDGHLRRRAPACHEALSALALKSELEKSDVKASRAPRAPSL